MDGTPKREGERRKDIPPACECGLPIPRDSADACMNCYTPFPDGMNGRDYLDSLAEIAERLGCDQSLISLDVKNSEIGNIHKSLGAHWDGEIVCTPCATKRRDEFLTAEEIAKVEDLAQGKPDAVKNLAKQGVAS